MKMNNNKTSISRFPSFFVYSYFPTTPQFEFSRLFVLLLSTVLHFFYFLDRFFSRLLICWSALLWYISHCAAVPVL